MKGDRWIFRKMTEARRGSFPGAQAGVYVPEGELLAEVTSAGMTTRQATAFSHSLADRLNVQIGSYRTRAIENPTLVHHGFAKSARWHVVTERKQLPLADLYLVSKPQASRIAEDIATAVGLPVLLVINKVREAFDDHKIVRSRGGFLSHGPRHNAKQKRRNPHPEPVKGQIWTSARGRCRIEDTSSRTQIQIYHFDTGNREWVQREDFFDSYKPPRTARNPARGGTVPAHTLKAGRTKPQARKSVENRRARQPRQRNPRSRGGGMARARRMFDTWHDDGRKPSSITRVKLPAPPKALARLGEIVSVVYESDKYAGSPDNPTGKKQLHEHRTKRPRPVLAADGDGRPFIVGGRMVATADGLIN